MKLYVISDYQSNRAYYKAGQEIEVDDLLGHWLLADASGCFSLEPPKVEAKEIEEPPKDKQVKRAPRKKSAGSK